MAVVWKLLALVALLLMSATMGSTPAIAHTMPAAAQPEHCADHHRPAETPPSAQLHCTVCAALPAMDAPAAAAPLMPVVPAQPRLAQVISGIDPETATPPPRRS